jgi:hypothetical protein
MTEVALILPEPMERPPLLVKLIVSANAGIAKSANSTAHNMSRNFIENLPE